MKIVTNFVLAAALISLKATANDNFQCTFNLKRGPQTQAFQLKQKLTVERKIIPYPTFARRNVQVTESIIPFEVYMGWEKFVARLTYRQAVEWNAEGRATRAALWECFDAQIVTADGLDELNCYDKDHRNDPFDDPMERWRPTQIINNAPGWKPGYTLRDEFTNGEFTLSVNCFALPLPFSDLHDL